MGVVSDGVDDVLLSSQNALLYPKEGSLRQVVLLRNSGSIQTLASKERLKSNEYSDTKEDRFIEGVVGSPVRFIWLK